MATPHTKPLFNREDARRMAKTLVTVRREQGEPLPDISTRRMNRMAASLVAGFAARPAVYRTARLDRVTGNGVILRIGGAY